MHGSYSNWRKSRHSEGGNGGCVEVASAASGFIGVRDTKQLGLGPVLEFAGEQWTAFVAGVRDGVFDLPGAN